MIVSHICFRDKYANIKTNIYYIPLFILVATSDYFSTFTKKSKVATKRKQRKYN